MCIGLLYNIKSHGCFSHFFEDVSVLSVSSIFVSLCRNVAVRSADLLTEESLIPSSILSDLGDSLALSCKRLFWPRNSTSH